MESLSAFYKNLTILFSSYNIKTYLQEAIESFLKLYPNLKNNIVIFEDESNDGTLEWLRENNIKTITWSKSIRNLIKEQGKHSSTFYCNMILNDAMLQIKTKYLFISDGDVIFYNKFLENYFELIKNNNVVGFLLKEDLTQNLKKSAIDDKIDLYFFEDSYFRLWQGHLLLNLKFLKENNIFYDTFDYMYYIENKDIDSGAYFIIELLNKKISFYDLMDQDYNKNLTNIYSEKNKIFQHIGQVACKQKWNNDGSLKGETI